MRCSMTTIRALIVAMLVHGLATAATTAESSSAKPLPSDGIIIRPGRYQLQQDLIVERDTGIIIEADDVTLDLAGHALRFNAKPRKDTYGVVANGRKNVTITSGSITAFWFNIHCTQNEGLRIDNVRFDDIPYIAINVGGGKRVRICDNTFTHFRYDVPKPAKDHYLIGINIGAEDVVISHNRFDAKYTGSNPRELDLETVFVLFAADVSQRCVVTHNQMGANTLLNRSYGIWVASNAHVTVVHNTIRNMKYGVSVESRATALAGFNQFSAEPTSAGVPAAAAFGIYAAAANKAFVIDNEFHGITTPLVLPQKAPGE